MSNLLEISRLTTKSENYASAQELLHSYGLDTSDIADETVCLWAATAAGAIVGVVGFERSMDIGLLRSLAVARSRQGEGIAKRLCTHVFDYSAEIGIDCLYLLTQSASEFFGSVGFSPIDRSHAPPGLTATSQFSSLCPDSAVVMMRPATR